MADNKSGYAVIDQLEDPDGVIAIISSRVRPSGATRHPPIITIGLFKRFTRDNDPDNKTSFMNINQVAAAHRILDRAEARAKELLAEATAEIEERKAR